MLGAGIAIWWFSEQHSESIQRHAWLRRNTRFLLPGLSGLFHVGNVVARQLMGDPGWPRIVTPVLEPAERREVLAHLEELYQRVSPAFGERAEQQTLSQDDRVMLVWVELALQAHIAANAALLARLPQLEFCATSLLNGCQSLHHFGVETPVQSLVTPLRLAAVIAARELCTECAAVLKDAGS